MNWIWPRNVTETPGVLVRTMRALHVGATIAALFFWAITILAVWQSGEGEPVAYVVVTFIWFAFAMLARGLRYIVTGE